MDVERHKAGNCSNESRVPVKPKATLLDYFRVAASKANSSNSKTAEHSATVRNAAAGNNRRPVSVVQPIVLDDQESSPGNNEGFKDDSETPHPLATPKEKYLWGLLKGRNFSRRNVDIKSVDGRGRSAFAAKPFKAGDFVCEYRGVVRKKTSDDWGDNRNASLGLGCYCYDVTYNNEDYVIDATGSINDPGRYINHAAKNHNLQTMLPVEIGEPPDRELRVGFVAKRDIKYGEELFFNYGIKPSKDFPWVSTDANKVATTLQEIDARSKAITKYKERRKPPNRTILSCPVPGCWTRNVIKLADHIRVQHPQFSADQRLEFIQLARKNAKREGSGRIQKAIRTIGSRRTIPAVAVADSLLSAPRTPVSAAQVTPSGNVRAATPCNSELGAISANVSYYGVPTASPVTANITYKGVPTCHGPITANVTYVASAAGTPSIRDPISTSSANSTVVPTNPSSILASITHSTSGVDTPSISDPISTPCITSTTVVPTNAHSNSASTMGAVAPSKSKNNKSSTLEHVISANTLSSELGTIHGDSSAAASDLEMSLSAETPVEFDFDGFKTYLKATYSKSKDTAKSTARDIKLFMEEACQTNYESNLLNLPLLEQFMTVMQEKLIFQPSTVAEKLRRIMLAIRYIIRTKTDQEYDKGKRVIGLIEEWIRGLGKDISIQRKDRALRVRQILHELEDPNEFLEHKMVKEKLSNAFADVRNGTITKATVNIITAYAAAAVLYGNGQRSGVITNLTIEEYNMREEADDGLVVIPCLKHKTAAQKLAMLVITEEIEEILEYYYENIRTTITPQEPAVNNNFFLTNNGGEYIHVYRHIKLSLAPPNLTPPQPGLYRILISSEARRHLDERKHRNIVKHLSHSMQTSQNYYELMDISDASEAHGSLHALSMLRRWTRDEIKAITEQWPLTLDNPPTFREVKDFIRSSGLERKSREIMFKWQQLKKSV